MQFFEPLLKTFPPIEKSEKIGRQKEPPLKNPQTSPSYRMFFRGRIIGDIHPNSHKCMSAGTLPAGPIFSEMERQPEKTELSC
ncbi:MAG: hypothetical protein WAV76_08580 [Bacteroidota bacterium]